MVNKDIKQFYLGSLLGVLLAYVPKIFGSAADGGITKLINWLPDKLAELLKLSATEGFGKFILVGDPKLWTVVVLAVIIGGIMMVKK